MRYEVRVRPYADSPQGSRFEIEREEPLVEGEVLSQFNMVYKVMKLLPGEDDFDGIAEAEWVAGAAHIWRGP